MYLLNCVLKSTVSIKKSELGEFMFEHFGAIDIFYGFYKHRKIFSLIISLFTVFFAFNFFTKISVPSNIENNQIYISSVSYYVEPNDYSSNDISSSSFPDNYIAMVNSDMCKKYIFDNLTSKYSKDFIVKQSELKSSEFEFGENSMSELYYIRRPNSSMILEISSVTYDRELSDTVRNLCHNFMTNVAGKYITNSSLKLSGKLDKDMKRTDIKSENFDSGDPRLIIKPISTSKISFSRSFIKHIIAPVIFIIMLCIIFIIIVGGFYPTINKASDFSDYGIPVITEFKNISKYKENK